MFRWPASRTASDASTRMKKAARAHLKDARNIWNMLEHVGTTLESALLALCHQTTGSISQVIKNATLPASPNNVLSFAMREIVLHLSVDRHPEQSASHSDLALPWSKAHLGESGPVEAKLTSGDCDACDACT